MENIDMGSIQVNDKKTIEKFTSNPDFPFLISFPRTGSHWLRMIMELYFQKPSLVRIFYYKDAVDFTCYHRHDEDLSIQRQNVIYLYRCPVETIYSQLNYYQEDIYDRKRIMYWADLYGRHLAKWLLQEEFTTRKTVITYEGMKKHMEGEFKKICDHFSVIFNRERLQPALTMVTKTEVKRKTVHDRQVINMSHRYKVEKKKFGKDQSAFIMDCIFSVSKKLMKFIGNPV
jgi:hypothetical protein